MTKQSLKSLSIFVIAVGFIILLYKSLYSNFLVPNVSSTHLSVGYWHILIVFFMLPFLFSLKEKRILFIYIYILYIVFNNLFNYKSLSFFIHNNLVILLPFISYIYASKLGDKSASFINVICISFLISLSFFIFQFFSSIFVLGGNRDYIFNIVVFLPFFYLVKNKYVQFFGLFLIYLLVLLSAKRSVIVGVLVFNLIYFFYTALLRFSFKKVLTLLFGVIFIYFFSQIFLPDTLSNIVDRFTLLSDDGGSSRDMIYFQIINSFNQSSIDLQLLGHGHSSAFDVGQVYAHSDFLELLYDYGILGLTFYIIFILSCISLPNKRSPQKFKISSVLTSAVFFYVLLGSMNCMIYSFTYMPVLFLFFGVSRSLLNQTNM